MSHQARSKSNWSIHSYGHQWHGFRINVLIILNNIIIFDSTGALDASSALKNTTWSISDTPSKILIHRVIGHVWCNTIHIYPSKVSLTACGCEDGTVRGVQVILGLYRWPLDVWRSVTCSCFSWHLWVLQSPKPQQEVWTRGCSISRCCLPQSSWYPMI